MQEVQNLACKIKLQMETHAHFLISSLLFKFMALMSEIEQHRPERMKKFSSKQKSHHTPKVLQLGIGSSLDLDLIKSGNTTTWSEARTHKGDALPWKKPTWTSMLCFCFYCVRDDGDVAPLLQEGITSAGTSMT